MDEVGEECGGLFGLYFGTEISGAVEPGGGFQANRLRLNHQVCYLCCEKMGQTLSIVAIRK